MNKTNTILRIRIFALTLVVSLTVASCGRTLTPTISTEGWSSFHKANFSIKLPRPFHEIETQGNDTSIYRFQGDSIEVTVEYGFYAKIGESLESQLDYREESIKLTGHPGKLISYSRSGENGEKLVDVVMVAVDEVGFSSNGLVATVQFSRESDRQTALSILGTIHLE